MDIYNGKNLEIELRKVIKDGNLTQFVKECTDRAIQVAFIHQMGRFQKPIANKVSNKNGKPVPPYIVVLKRAIAMHNVFIKSARFFEPSAVGSKSFNKAHDRFTKFMNDFYASLVKASKKDPAVQNVLESNIGVSSGTHARTLVENSDEIFRNIDNQYGTVSP